MDNIFFTILAEFGLPVAAAVVMGYFIFLILKYILESVIGQVSGMHGIIMEMAFNLWTNIPMYSQ